MFRTASCALLLWILGLASTSSQAAIIEGNDPRYPGTANTTIDTATGLEWLDWKVTALRSYSTVSSNFRKGGNYEGWRYATEDEVGVFFAHLGLPTTSFPAASQSVDAGVSEWNAIKLLEPLHSSPMSSGTYTQALIGRGVIAKVFVASYMGPPVGSNEIVRANSMSATYFSQDLGNALVRLVPEPSGLAMLCVVAPAIVRLFRRRSRR